MCLKFEVSSLGLFLLIGFQSQTFFVFSDFCRTPILRQSVDETVPSLFYAGLSLGRPRVPDPRHFHSDCLPSGARSALGERERERGEV